MGSDEVYDFGMRLKELRKKYGLTQKQVAEKLGVRKETISHYENNTQTPSLDTVIKLAVLYHTSLDYLMGIENEPVIKLHNLSEAQKKWLNETIKLFFR